MNESQRLIEELGLQPHPEGGHYRETYRSPIEIDTPRGKRSAITSIYYLLAGDEFSAFHRIESDEIWHHCRGEAVAVDIIEADGSHRQVTLGGGNPPQFAIPAGAWFAAHLCAPNAYALLGCDVAPGFEFNDFEVARRDELAARFPQHRALIEHWTLAAPPLK